VRLGSANTGGLRILAMAPAGWSYAAIGREEAISREKALALRVLADRLEHGESVPELVEGM